MRLRNFTSGLSSNKIFVRLHQAYKAYQLKLSTFTKYYFSNDHFDQLREAFELLKEDNRNLLENGVQQAKDFGADIERLNAELELAQALVKTKDSSLKEAEEESELLLLQLHQVQEELESVFLKEQETQGLLDEQLKVAKKYAHEIESLAQEKTTITASRDEQLKLVQVHEQQIQTANLELEKLSKQNADLAQQVEQYKTGVQVQFKEAQDENELLLLQLHQVQEELEHYFIESQRLQRENESYLGRWQRLEDRQPNYLDFESIAPTSVDVVSENPRIEWSVRDILVGGTMYPEFKFVTFMEDGLSGVELLMNDADNKKARVRIVPRALLRPQAVKAISEFRNMSALDWRQIQVAIGCVEMFFRDPVRHAGVQKFPEGFDLVFWRQMSAPLLADVRSLPAVFRFNQTKLKRELIHPDYEHLWLEIYDATFGERHWPKLEIRLGAANIQPGAFSRYPKIEIPRIDGKTAPFASWFEESFDDFGGKLELRFDLNKQLFDLGVWIKLSNEDQKILLSMIGVLPLVLKALEQDKTAIARPWDSWSGLVSGLINVMRKRLDEVGEVLKQDAEKKQVAAQKESAQLAVKEEAQVIPALDVTPEQESVTSVDEDLSPPVEVADMAQQPEILAASKSSRYVPARQKKLRGR
jgi:hypothetical protein